MLNANQSLRGKGSQTSFLRYVFCCLTLVAFSSSLAYADKGPSKKTKDKQSSQTKEASKKTCADIEEPTWSMKTLGGRQFWGDVHFFRGWKIQQNVITGHYRLLDQRDYRYTWGTFNTCLKKLDEIKAKCELKPLKGEKVVILVHGIVRSSKSMKNMKMRLEDEGFVVVPFDYPSTRVSMQKTASYLQRVIASMDGASQINFVTHSMGGLIVRAWSEKNTNKKIGRLVMIGTPNKGAELADMLKDWKIFKYIYGPAGQQLASNEDGTIANLPIPKFSFGVIAGAKGTINGYNPLIPGDDDGTVAVESARLEGADDFLAVKTLHSFLPSNAEVMDSAIRFLKSGAFRENGQKEPIKAKKQTQKNNPKSDTSGTSGKRPVGTSSPKAHSQ